MFCLLGTSSNEFQLIEIPIYEYAMLVGTHLLHLDKLVGFNGYCFQPTNTNLGIEPQASATSVTTELAHHY